MKACEAQINPADNMTVREFLGRKKLETNNFAGKRDGEISEPKIMTIPVMKLKSTSFAQRVFIKSHVQKIVDNFDPKQLQPIVVSHRDGCYYIVDGDHRTAAVRIKFGREHLMNCMVVEGLTETEEAKLFIDLNKNRKPLTAVDEAKGRYNSGDKVIRDLYKICEKNHILLDIKVETANKADNASEDVYVGTVKCVRGIERVYRDLGYDYDKMFRIVKLLSSTWFDDKNTFQEPMLKMMALLIETYGDEISDRVFISNLSASSETTPDKIMSKARERKFSRERVEIEMARIVVDRYNTGKAGKRNKKLEKYKLDM